eukprot:TRINITY_DN779868_c0_g1_i1.p1 TRINITY_DN779868_c0_g1~~TRINITY_DN779868_c0_g1_i1.p1  ORF type:complete len:134 (+),score=25.56 TRINITY_DN779868_c0_g1_i1:104-505(+)
MSLLAFFIVNTAGGLIYHKSINGYTKLEGNDFLRMASTFHSLHAISDQLSPLECGGIDTLEADSFILKCLETRTHIKFVVIANSDDGGLNSVLKKAYVLYSDYVLKNPFQDMDMPIRCELFDKNLAALFDESA